MGPAASVAAALLGHTPSQKPRGQRGPESNSGCQWLAPTCPLIPRRAFHPMHPSRRCFQNEGSYFPTLGSTPKPINTPKCQGGSLSRLGKKNPPKNNNKNPQQRPRLYAHCKLALASTVSERSHPAFHQTICLFLSHCHSMLCASTRSCVTQIEETHWAEMISFKIVLVRLVSSASIEKGHPSPG